MGLMKGRRIFSDAGFIWKGRAKEDLKKCTRASPFVTLGPLSWECVRSFVVICWERDSNTRERISFWMFYSDLQICFAKNFQLELKTSKNIVSSMVQYSLSLSPLGPTSQFLLCTTISNYMLLTESSSQYSC